MQFWQFWFVIQFIVWFFIFRPVVKMKMKLLILIAAFLAILVVFVVIMRLATPEVWPIPTGTLKAKKVTIGQQAFVMIDGEGMNYLGQIQSINVTVDSQGKRFVVNRCLIRKNPFTSITVNNQWPVLYSLESLPAGNYPVVYQSTTGDAVAGTIEVP